MADTIHRDWHSSAIWHLLTFCLWQCVTVMYTGMRMQWVTVMYTGMRMQWGGAATTITNMANKRPHQALQKVPRHACVVFTGFAGKGPQGVADALASGIATLHEAGVDCVTVCNTALPEGRTTKVLVDLLGARLESSLGPETTRCILRDGLTGSIEVVRGTGPERIASHDGIGCNDVGAALQEAVACSRNNEGLPRARQRELDMSALSAVSSSLVVNVVGASQGADDLLGTVLDTARGERGLVVDMDRQETFPTVETVCNQLRATRLLPDPDLIIRCSDVPVLDGFLPWQSHLAEILFVSENLEREMAPDRVRIALEKFAKIERRQGR